VSEIDVLAYRAPQVDGSKEWVTKLPTTILLFGKVEEATILLH
jgi:hypothetical protein